MRIAFDVGNVLVKVDFREFFEEFRKLHLRADPFRFARDIQAPQDIGVETVHTALRSRFDLPEECIARLVDAWNIAIEPNQEMLDFVDDLKGKGVEVAVLSNMGSEHATYIRENYPRIFDGNILHLSSEVGARKPTKLYYQSFLMQHRRFMGAIFLDDREENLTAAKEFGMRGYHFELNKFVEKPDNARADILNYVKEEVGNRNGYIF